MAIPTTDVNVIGDLVYQLWGNLLGASPSNISINNLGLTINGTAPHQTNEFESVSVSFSRTPASHAWTAAGTKVVTVTANCAWKAAISGDTTFTIQSLTGNVTLSGSGASAIVGGNGSITILQYNSGVRSATLTITYSNGAGGSSSQTVSLSSNF